MWLDNSKISQLEICPRSYFYRYELDLTMQQKSLALAYGTTVHKALELGFREKHKGREAAMAASVNAIMPAWEAELESLMTNPSADLLSQDWRGPDIATELVVHFWTSQWPLIESWEVIGTELGYEVTIPGTQATYRCRIDLVCQQAGMLFIVDHKTTSWQISRIINADTTAPQLPSYMAALQLAGFNPSSALYNYLFSCRRKLSSGSWSKPSIDCQLFPTVCPSNRVANAARRMQEAVKQIEACKEAGWWPMKLFSCPGQYRTCEFLQLCDLWGWDELPEADQVIKEALALGYRQEPWNPFKEDLSND